MAGVRAAALCVLVVIAAAIQLASGQLVIVDVHRKIDISTFKAVHETKLTLKNDGKAAVNNVVLCERSSLLDHAAILEVGLDAAPAGASALLRWAEAPVPDAAPAGVACRLYDLGQPLKAGGSITLRSAAIYTHVLRPEPAKIPQSEPQRVKYEDTAQLISPYKVAKQITEIALGTTDVQSFTKVEPAKRSGRTLTYGPYTGVAPFASQPFTVHYENVAPFAVATELEREIQISHWGNVYFEERYQLRHAGAKVVGEWSRFDLMTKPTEFGRAAIPMMTALVPPTAHSLYFRDGIGNISSSEVRVTREATAVNLIPRYPLFGGWSAKFLFGWSMPLRDTVVKDAATGRMSFVTPIGSAIRGLVVDSLTVKIVLPEGARDPKIDTQMPLAEAAQLSTQFTYLDVMGRPVVVLRLKNVVQELNLPFRVEYTHSSLGLLQKPLLLVAAFGVLFLAAIVLNRSGSSLASSASMQALVKPHAS